MSRLSEKLGEALFWLMWPVFWFGLRGSRRTRLALWSGGRLLVVKNRLGSSGWSLPGGGLHKDEPAITGVLRELREETGIKLSPESLVSLGTHVYRNSGLRFEYELFRATLPQPLPPSDLPLEIVRAEWVSAETLQQQDCRPDVAAALATWQNQPDLV